MTQRTPPARLVVELAKTYALAEFYPPMHPTLVHGLHTVENLLLASGHGLSLAVTPVGAVTVDGVRAPRSAHVERFGAQLAAHGVESLLVRSEVGEGPLGRFLSAVALPPRVARAAGGLAAAYAAVGGGRISINGSPVRAAVVEEPAPIPSEEVAEADVVEPGDAHADGDGTEPVEASSGIELWSAHEMYEQVRHSAARVESEDLEELRRLLHQGEERDRLQVLNRLEFLGQYLVEHGELNRGLELVQGLCRDAESMRGRNPAARGLVMLAIERIATRPFIDGLVEGLGRARSEEDRAALKATIVHVGASAVTPLVQALIASKDAGSRRAYRDALVALDAVGIELMEDMVGDDRWFVVRNMVGILGETRSADAIEHFSRTIAHSDARVRRETIMALAKVSGEEAVPLLVKGLQDPDAGLRASAALGLGLTKQPAGVAPLLARLADESEPEVEVEIVRALGRIGDARAIRVLAERATGGGWFSRVAAPIRVEAVRALGEIRDGDARAVLQRLLRDRNAEVRQAAVLAVG
jgi:HEAT repeat protein